MQIRDVFCGLASGVVALASVLVGCSRTTTHPTALAEDQQYWTANLNHHGITLATTAPYDTVQLTVTPRTATGAVLPIPANAVLTYLVSDSSVATVSPTGLVTAVAPGQSIDIVARLTIGNLTLTDTALLNVNNIPVPPPVMTTLTLTPAPGTAAVIAADGFQGLVIPIAIDAEGDTIQNVSYALSSSDTTRAVIDQFGDVTGAAPGNAVLYVDADVYGVSLRDSLLVTITQPLFSVDVILAETPKNSLTPISYFSPGTTKVAVGGYVIWLNQSNQPVDIVFDNPAGVQAVPDSMVALLGNIFPVGVSGDPNTGGNIPSFAAIDSTSYTDGTGIRIRYFPQAGTYTFHSTLYNTTGSVVVGN